MKIVLLANPIKEEVALPLIKLSITVQVALLVGIVTLNYPTSQSSFVLIGVHQLQHVVLLLWASFLVPERNQSNLLLEGKWSETLGHKCSIVVEGLQTGHISDHVEAVEVIKSGCTSVPLAPSRDRP